MIVISFNIIIIVGSFRGRIFVFEFLPPNRNRRQDPGNRSLVLLLAVRDNPETVNVYL